MKVKTERGITKLILGEREQSSWCQDNPDYLMHTYVRMIALASLTWQGYKSQRRGRALVIGLGGGILCRFFQKHFENLRIDVVEPDARVLEYARKHFDLDRRVQVHLTDGRTYMASGTGTFDLIVLDAFDKTYIPAELMTLEFLRIVKSRLRPGGVLIANTWVLPELTAHENNTYGAVFRPIWDFRKVSDLEGNRIILYNSGGVDRLDQLLDLVKLRAAIADYRNPISRNVGKRKEYYLGLTGRLHISLIGETSPGRILTDRNVHELRLDASFA